MRNNDAQRILLPPTSVKKGDPRDTFTKIPNAVLGFLIRVKLAPALAQMILAAFRYRHGWHIEDDPFSLAELKSWLHWGDRRLIFRAAQELIDRGIFVVNFDDKTKAKYRIQQDPRKWKTIRPAVRKKVSSQLTTKTSSVLTTKVSSKLTTSSLFKEIGKEITKKPPHPPATLALFKKNARTQVIPEDEFFELIKEKSPDELEAIYRKRTAL